MTAGFAEEPRPKVTTSSSFDAAVEHASQNVPIFPPTLRWNEARVALSEKVYDHAAHLIICEGRKFLGLVRIEEFFAAAPDAFLGDIMDRDAPVVAPGEDQELAAAKAVRHRESALAVVDADGRFLGLIPPERLLRVLLSEHEEDLSRIGGFTSATAAARQAGEEAVERRFRHRLPWLLVGLGGALLAADLVGWFEAQLQTKVMLAFFLPGIVYLADAVGTQTETVVVRGLSVGLTMRRMLKRELLSGVAIGLALAAVAGPLVWWRWGEQDLALCVALAVFAASSTATVAAMTLPWLLQKSGFDPAFGSGPLATVIQDLLSILIYFAIASAVL